MYDEILSMSIITTLFTGIFITLFTYFALTKFMIYKIKNRFSVELYILKNVLSPEKKLKLKNKFKKKKEEETNYIKNELIFIFGLIILLLVLLLIRYLISPEKTIQNVSNVFAIKNIPLILGIIMFQSIANGIITITISNFYTIEYISVIVKRRFNQYINNLLNKL